MGILIPTQTLTGPSSPLLGAATGLFEGLSQGIPIAEQMLRRKEESQRQNTELAMAQQAQQRKFSSQDASKRAAQALLQASLMNAGASGASSGVSSPPGGAAGSGAPALPGFQTLHPGAAPGDLADLGQEQGPGVGGNPLQGPPEQGQPGQQTGYSGHQPTGNPGTDWLFDQMHNGALKDISVEDAEKIAEAHTRDLHLQAITQHAGRINDTIQRGLDKGAYDAVDEDGHPDPSARIEMEGLQRRIQSLDRTDPKAAAALLDQAEQVEAQARTYKAHAEMGFMRRQGKIQGLQSRIDSLRASGVVSPADEPRMEQLQRLQSLYTNHIIDDKELSAMQPDAEMGMLDAKAQVQQAQIERDRAIAEYNRLRGSQFSPEAIRNKTNEEIRKGIAIKGAPGPLAPRASTENSKAQAEKYIGDILDKKFFNHGMKSETPEQKAAYDAENQRLHDEIFGKKGALPSPVQGPPGAGGALPKAFEGHEDEIRDIIRRMNSGELNDKDAADELRELGIDPDAEIGG